jgi:hypothetical protein
MTRLANLVSIAIVISDAKQGNVKGILKDNSETTTKTN